MAIHVVYVRQTQVNNGQVVDKTNATINQVMKSSMEMRIVPDATVPNSAGSPSIKDYLIAEDGDGFNLSHMDNTIIVTQQP